MKIKIVVIIAATIFFSCKDTKNSEPSNKLVDSLNISSPYLLNQILVGDTASNIEQLLSIVSVLDSASLYPQAIKVMNRVLESDSLNSFFWLRKGQLLKLANDTPSAIKMFEYASKIYADAPQLMEWANLLAETKNPKALQITRVLRNNNPSKKYHAQADFFDGIFYAKTGDKVKAITQFDKAIILDYLFLDAYIEKGYLLFSDNKINEALFVFEQSTKANLRFADGYYWQAKCLETLNKKEEAVEMYKQCLVLDKSIIEAKEAIERLK